MRAGSSFITHNLKGTWHIVGAQNRLKESGSLE